MPHHDEDGPVYYREIQKSAYLKRVPNESTGSKLLPLGNKKDPAPLWTQLCVHNGRSPYLEQYCSAPRAPSHAPLWRASLARARHVTAAGCRRHEFVIHTEEGLVRMRAPDWESMQDWVRTLRCKLHALQILSGGENVYASSPSPSPAAVSAPPPPPPGPGRPPARDPTSPLPPTPAAPPDRVPGIELTPLIRQPQVSVPEETATEPETTQEPSEPNAFATTADNHIATAEIDISDWDSTLKLSKPSTSQHSKSKAGVAKICGQNICLDDSVLKRNTDGDNEIDRLSISSDGTSIENGSVNGASDVSVNDVTRVLVNAVGDVEAQSSDFKATNITVIEVSNKQPESSPNSTEAQVFNIEIKTDDADNDKKYVNIVNTDNTTGSPEGDYGTVFSTTKTDGEYDHISLTTTLIQQNEDVYERLCMATTSVERSVEISSPISLRKLHTTEGSRKSSLPNLEVESDSSQAYGCVYPDSNQNPCDNVASCSGDLSAGNTGGVKINQRLEDLNGSQPANVSVASVMNGRADLAMARSNVTDVSVVNRSVNNESDCDVEARRNVSPLRVEKPSSQCSVLKPLWKRGLTEFSLLSRLKGLGPKRAESPTRLDNDRNVTSSVKLRERPERRVDSSRRRSNSLSNGAVLQPSLQSHVPPVPRVPRVPHVSGVPPVSRVPPVTQVSQVAARRRVKPILVAHDNHVWVCSWRGCGHSTSGGGRPGDRLVAVNGVAPKDVNHAHALLNKQQHKFDILFQRVPLGVWFILKREREDENIGVIVDGDCMVTGVMEGSPASRAALPPPGSWCLTEVNGRMVNLLKGAQEDIIRLSACGKEVSVLLQPAVLVKKIRAALKSNKSILGLR